ncbi:tRNA dimethylallyltransferase 2 isoform X1 [Olea europaea subsp. europaea]|uniref:tRNA dimethylallyltransferase 2 isoform X1 n=1 Tax=Olea europaea subsp. europaea TaxID=158383 RepID=A0A8S0QL83_OLEEU|nr:tRNA dimethylallyltransferase 2 isoform X1 [Olea europaea subsp. europaea]
MERGNPPQEPKGNPQMMNGDLNSNPNMKSKPKIVVIMGATGSGKSKLAIDLASHFPIEIINADSMQAYQGLDVLTNKVPVQDQKGVRHHLLGTISPHVEFTAKDFRDCAIPLIIEIWSRNCLPVIVGGTNYYIQALVSQFLLDDYIEDQEANYLFNLPGDKKPDFELELEPIGVNGDYTYSHLKDLDPVAANRIHPNDHRKINQYISLYIRSGVRPSELLQGNIKENWGRANNFRYDCCFICLDASVLALDQYVDQRVDCMIDAGLLEEVFDIYKLNADYTRGLRQAIGVREFEDFLRRCTSECQNPSEAVCSQNSNAKQFKEIMRQIMDSPIENQQKILLTEAIDKVKLNTRRLVRRQKRRLSRLQMLFEWNIHYVDVTGCLLSASDDIWIVDVVEPSLEIIKSFLDKNNMEEARSDCEVMKSAHRDLWTQYICKVSDASSILVPSPLVFFSFFVTAKL